MHLIAKSRASAVLFSFLRSIPPDFVRGRYFLIPAAICPVVPLTFFKSGLDFGFYDISAESMLPDHGLVERVRRERNRIGGILYSGTFGYLPENTDLYTELKSISPDLQIIEDRCLCPPEFSEARQSRLADLIIYSTGYAKYVDLGFGGFGFSKAPIAPAEGTQSFNSTAWSEIERKSKEALNYSRRFIYQDTKWLKDESIPVRFTEYKEKVAAESEQSKIHKANLNLIYRSNLPQDAALSEEFQNWRYTILLNEPNAALDALRAAGLFASRHFQPLDGVFSKEMTCPNSKMLHKYSLNLFNDRYFTAAQAGQAAEILRRFPAPKVKFQFLERGYF